MRGYAPSVAMLSIEPNPRITFKVRFRDEDLLVVEKRSGLTTQPGKGHTDDTLLNGLFAEYGAALQNLGKARDFGLLHRLDKDTSGLLVVGLTARAYDGLREAFERREVKKFYWAVCAKAPSKEMGVVDLPLVETTATKGGQKLARISKAAGKPAATAYRVLQASANAALLEARPLTGRLHQVRVHLEAIGCPILGDTFYANRTVAAAAPRLALHAHRLIFKHPVTGEKVDVTSPWPSDLRRTLKRFGLERPDLPSGGGQDEE